MIQKLPPTMMKISTAVKTSASRFSLRRRGEVDVQEEAQMDQDLQDGGDARSPAACAAAAGRG